jgi:CheY-like chemotaxis protein
VFRLSAPQISEEDMLSKMEEGALIQSEEIDETCKESVNDSQYFPLKEKDVEEIHQIELTLDPKETRRFHNLLVTDDSAVNRKMMCRSLQSVGYKCFQAADGQECVDIVGKVMRNEHESIDLVLMDYEMPRMNGPTACAALRAMGCGIPVVGVTGNVLNEDKQLFMEHGAVRVLQKPFSVTDLDDALEYIYKIQSHGKNVRQTIDG